MHHPNKEFQKALSNLVDTIRRDETFPEEHTVKNFAPTGDGMGAEYLEISFKLNPTVAEYSRKLLSSARLS